MGEPIRLGGNFGFTLQNGKLDISVHDVLVNGQAIKPFSAGWIGMALAEAVMHALGGLIFSALTDTLSQSNQPSLSDLLSKAA